MAAQTGYAVADIPALKAISPEKRSDGYTKLVKSALGNKPAWYTFIASSTSVGDNDAVIVPDDNPESGRFLKSSGSNSSNSNVSVSDATSNTKGIIQLSGDLGGTATAPTIITSTAAKWNANQIQSRPVSNNAPNAGQVLYWDGSTWKPGNTGGAPEATLVEQGLIQLAGDLGGTATAPLVVSSTTAKWNANQLQGRAVSNVLPSADQVLTWNNTSSRWEARDTKTPPPPADATDKIKGIIQLAGDLGGTAAEPTISTFSSPKWNANRLQGRPIVNVEPADGQTLVWNSALAQWEPGSTVSESSANLSRTEIVYTTAALNPGSTENGLIGLGRSFLLLRIKTNVVAWVRMYSKASYRTADATRNSNQDADASVGSGIIAEVITNTGLTIDLSPMAVGANLEVPSATNIPIAITNLSGARGAIAVTFTTINIEA